MQKILITIIHGYRYLLSPWLGRHCRFHPSCSEFAAESIATHGSLHGSWLALRRLLRCHPWHSGGYDPVPPATPPHSGQSPRHG